ncbi:hypothetical protein BAE44_0025322 [Dichanthelium oligosanthes]|uniref:DUF1618 domain-containing protein n=1 Tax=Dichanthelium oligosanthes TaxID=888268 RepID=A0A1E5ULB4_9POAL|nr:hypothetical protein BAE44_0025322 [Dichanthelium oligosanthes]
MFEPFCTREVLGCCSSSTADAKTLAGSRTTTGLPINVSLCLAAPPEGSRVCVQLPVDIVESYTAVLAAHGDSVVVQVKGMKDHKVEWTDHFIYNAGDAAAVTLRPPSLLLLPADGEEEDRPVRCYQGRGGTGLLRRGEDEFVVAEVSLRTAYDKSGKKRDAAELRMLRSGKWCIKRPPISRYNDGEGGEPLASTWQSNMVVPVGDQLLCWVDLSRGLLISNVFDESPGLRYVQLPADPRPVGSYVDFHPSYRNVCVTAGGGAVKFVNIFRRCCCGGEGQTNCKHSRNACTVHTWTLRMDDDMSWVMDGILDATQLWALDSYKGLPRSMLGDPVVSMDDPHAICFVVTDRKMWRIMVDMRSKTIQSVFRYPKEGTWYHVIPSRVSNYFSSKPRSSKPEPAQADLKRKKIKLQTRNTIETLVHPPCKSSFPPMQTMEAASPEAMILAALDEIPGLDRDDVLKAYRILSHDDSGRRFRSLMGLPMNLRKDYVLMDIKATLPVPSPFLRVIECLVCVRPPGKPTVAAHGDSMIVQAGGLKQGRGGWTDQFIYRPGDAAAVVTPRPPSLWLLPASYHITDEQKRPEFRYLDQDGDRTGFLHRVREGQVDDFVVAGLRMATAYVWGRWAKEAELRLLRCGEWSYKKLLVSHCDDGEGWDDNLAFSWRNDMVLPVGDQLLCWVELSEGLLLSNVFDEIPGLHYVPLPVDSTDFIRPLYRNACHRQRRRNQVRRHLPSLLRRRRRSHLLSKFWTRLHRLQLDAEDGRHMAWELDDVLHATELWALDGYKGLPRVELDYPVVSMDDPHAISFVVCEQLHKVDGDRTMWRIMVDMRSKTIRSVFRDPEGGSNWEHLVPSRISNYFNSKPSSSNLDPAQVALLQK